MNPVTSSQITDWREGRRMRAFELYQAGWCQKAIAEALGVTQGAVSQWLKSARHHGPEALRRRRAPGASPRLTPEQKAQLPALLARGPAAYGFSGPSWTLERVAEVIRREFGVSYHPTHVSRLLRALRLTGQRPNRLAA